MMFKKNILTIIRKATVQELEEHLEQYPETLNAPTGSFTTNYVNGITPLVYAAAINKPDMLEALIKAGANVDKTAWNGRIFECTALHMACEKNNKRCVETLIAADACTDITNRRGQTPSDVAQAVDIKKLVLPSYLINPQKEETIQGYNKESDYMVSHTQCAEASNVTIRLFFDFKNKVIHTQIKDKDGQSNYPSAFNQAACPEQVEEAAAFLVKNNGNTHGFQPRKSSPIT